MELTRRGGAGKRGKAWESVGSRPTTRGAPSQVASPEPSPGVWMSPSYYLTYLRCLVKVVYEGGPSHLLYRVR